MRHISILLLIGSSLLIATGLRQVAAGDKKSDGYTKIFDGKTLDGWHISAKSGHSGKSKNATGGKWVVEDGAIVGTQYIKGNGGIIITDKKYKDFELKCQVRLKDGKGNSGVQIRSRVINPEKFVVGGPQADIGAGYWGSLYGEQFGGMMKQSPPALVKKVVKPSDFNDYYIKCVGKHVTIKINGETMVDDTFARMPEEGIIAFQLHGGPPMEVVFKNIHFKDLSAQ